MAWHIRMGRLPWCRSPYAERADLAMVAECDGIVLHCMHVTKARAARMVTFLQQHGVDFARVVEGECEEKM